MPKQDCVVKCANCAHFETEGGLCHRNPPVPMMTEEGMFWAFPECDPDDWCGEFAGVN